MLLVGGLLTCVGLMQELGAFTRISELLLGITGGPILGAAEPDDRGGSLPATPAVRAGVGGRGPRSGLLGLRVVVTGAEG
ncbi:hypothetical protein ABZ802_14490 [Streptomyces sp. NPDC047737]|uniref:hypothetical protein n=1 Tax=Streptomyces sp. NPDC047737 TaxID=3155740 RepID=UPI0033D6562A